MTSWHEIKVQHETLILETATASIVLFSSLTSQGPAPTLVTHLDKMSAIMLHEAEVTSNCKPLVLKM